MVKNAVAAERPVRVRKWYLCPQCKGLGEVPSDRPRRLFRGVYHLRHVICDACKGLKMVEIDSSSQSAANLPVVEKCNKCGNWYAVGAGRPLSEPCYQEHAERSHCHWHDLSMPKPPYVLEDAGKLSDTPQALVVGGDSLSHQGEK